MRYMPKRRRVGARGSRGKAPDGQFRKGVSTYVSNGALEYSRIPVSDSRDEQGPLHIPRIRFYRGTGSFPRDGTDVRNSLPCMLLMLTSSSRDRLLIRQVRCFAT